MVHKPSACTRWTYLVDRYATADAIHHGSHMRAQLPQRSQPTRIGFLDGKVSKVLARLWLHEIARVSFLWMRVFMQAHMNQPLRIMCLLCAV
ncbi:hypothetical protein CY34DRAFT_200138 [Suillus luteus UH-Slu-Lm8-n1]|uniref:Uncharacterized protein n=1 Tax=Suillus luteus UH-Slu-Lm8-n1 TaxID=930992 RepID=A0A0D0AUD3_9AGAM|nr:hypothetical protein CY34DRAFT_200138 [Suillus luteus UH-Slu-Lm8-n1]